MAFATCGRLQSAKLVICLASSLAACSSKIEDAQQEYNVVSNNGSLAEKCEKAREIQSAYFKARDEQSYSRWKLKANTDCLMAEQLGGNSAANEEERAKAEEEAADAANHVVNEERFFNDIGQ